MKHYRIRWHHCLKQSLLSSCRSGLSSIQGKTGWERRLVQPTGPEEPEKVGEAWEGFGGGDGKNAKLPGVQEKPILRLLAPDSGHSMGGMTAFPSAHLTCQLNFFGLTLQTWVIYN